METKSDLLLARVEANYPIRYSTRLVRFKDPVPLEGVESNWALQDGFLVERNKSFRVTRCAPLKVNTEKEALAIFQNAEAKSSEDILPLREKLSNAQVNLENAKWRVQKDTHGQAIRSLEKLDSTETADKLLDNASKQFAIDIMARTGQRLHPVDYLTPEERKSLARRCRKMKNRALRHLVRHWLKEGYEKLHAPQLAAILFQFTDQRMSPAALTKARERLGLYTKVEGRPPNVLES